MHHQDCGVCDTVAEMLASSEAARPTRPPDTEAEERLRKKRQQDAKELEDRRLDPGGKPRSGLLDTEQTTHGED